MVRYWQANTENGWREIKSKPKCISNDGIWLLDETRRGEGLCLLPRWGLDTDLVMAHLLKFAINAKVSVAGHYESIYSTSDQDTESPRSKPQ